MGDLRNIPTFASGVTRFDEDVVILERVVIVDIVDIGLVRVIASVVRMVGRMVAMLPAATRAQHVVASCR